jgi:hypothetical protein
MVPQERRRGPFGHLGYPSSAQGSIRPNQCKLRADASSGFGPRGNRILHVRRPIYKSNSQNPGKPLPLLLSSVNFNRTHVQDNGRRMGRKENIYLDNIVSHSQSRQIQRYGSFLPTRVRRGVLRASLKWGKQSGATPSQNTWRNNAASTFRRTMFRPMPTAMRSLPPITSRHMWMGKYIYVYVLYQYI